MTLRLPFSFRTTRRYAYIIALLLLLIAGALAVGLGRNQPAQHPEAVNSLPLSGYQTDEPQSGDSENYDNESQRIISAITPSSIAEGIKPQKTVVAGFYKKKQAEEDSTGETE